MSKTSLADRLRKSVARRYKWAFTGPGFIPTVVMDNEELSMFHELEAENRKKHAATVASLIGTLDPEQRELLNTILWNEESIRELRMLLGERDA